LGKLLLQPDLNNEKVYTKFIEEMMGKEKKKRNSPSGRNSAFVTLSGFKPETF
jgi:hypothetical protein